MDPNTRLFAMGAAGQALAIPDIGQPFEGGFVAGYISDTADGNPTRVLIVAPKASGENTSAQWRTSNAGDTNPPSQNQVYGKLATDFFTGTTYPAFNWAKGLSINGYTDWYIPARNELEVLYRNLKPTTTSNNTSSGANPNGVTGATSNYTSGNPAQTSITAFQSGNSEAIASALCWSSSENSSSTSGARYQSFNDGGQDAGGKSGIRRARAIRSLSIIPTPGDIGDAYGGGYYAGQILVGGTVYNLVVAPKASGENTSVRYKTSNTADTNPNSQNQGYGKLATDQFAGSGVHPAFAWAAGLTINGFSDWYIPAQNELEILYRNLKPTTGSNNTSSGANPNAYPSPTPNYTSGNPAQTSVTAFQTGNSEAFASAVYWSSSQVSSNTLNAWSQGFGNGIQNSTSKNNNFHARAIRRVAA